MWSRDGSRLETFFTFSFINGKRVFPLPLFTSGTAATWWQSNCRCAVQLHKKEIQKRKISLNDNLAFIEQGFEMRFNSSHGNFQSFHLNMKRFQCLSPYAIEVLRILPKNKVQCDCRKCKTCSFFRLENFWIGLPWLLDFIGSYIHRVGTVWCSSWQK